MGEEVTIESSYIYRGAIVNLRVDRVRLADGREARREIVEHRGAVALVAVDEAGNVILVRQYRKPAEEELLEIPAGTLEPGEDPLACAHRELEEETGYRAGRLIPLASFYSSPGFCTEVIHVYLATALSPAAQKLEADEDIRVVKIPFRQAITLIQKGEIKDAKSIAGLLLALDKLESEADE